MMILYYVHDPMCSWCWGFRPTWGKIRANLPAGITVSYLLGGLAPDSDEPMSASMQKDIASYWRKIQKHIPNTTFNYDFWDKCEPKRSTYPACRAVIAARQQGAEKEIEMISAIQSSYYLEARNPSEDDTLIDIATSLGFDRTQFINALHAKETQAILDAEIAFGRKIGAQGFPSLILEKAGKYHYVPLNYNRAEQVLDSIRQLADD